MKTPQTIKLNIGLSGDVDDAVMAFDEESVIKDSTQEVITDASSPISVDVVFYDLVEGGTSTQTAEEINMTYVPLSGYWKIDIQDLIDKDINFIDRHKYVGKISEHSGGTVGMRPFKINEFTIDNDSFESTLMRLPYEIETYDGGLSMVWKTEISSGDILYYARVYEGGNGTVRATSYDKITHRGPVIPVIPV